MNNLTVEQATIKYVDAFASESARRRWAESFADKHFAELGIKDISLSYDRYRIFPFYVYLLMKNGEVQAGRSQKSFTNAAKNIFLGEKIE